MYIKKDTLFFLILLAAVSSSCKVRAIYPTELPADGQWWLSVFVRGLTADHSWCTPSVWTVHNGKIRDCLQPKLVKNGVDGSAYVRCIPTASGEVKLSFSGVRCDLRGECKTAQSLFVRLCNASDSCGVCGGNGSSCAGCDGIPASDLQLDVHGVCESKNLTAEHRFVRELNKLRVMRGLKPVFINEDLQRLSALPTSIVHPVDAASSRHGYFHFLGDSLTISDVDKLRQVMEVEGYEQLIHPVFTEIGVSVNEKGSHTIIMGSRLQRCGDGIVQAELGEVCDDGNTVDGDGCSSNCSHIESGWRCSEGSPRHPSSICVRVQGNITVDGNDSVLPSPSPPPPPPLSLFEQLELEFLNTYLLLINDSRFHACSVNASSVFSNITSSADDWKSVLHSALLTAEKFLFEGAPHKSLLTLRSIRALCEHAQTVRSRSFRSIYNRSIVGFEDSYPDYDMNDHVSMIHGSSFLTTEDTLFTLLHIHPLARGSVFSHQLHLLLPPSQNISAHSLRRTRSSRCSSLQASLPPSPPNLKDCSFKGRAWSIQLKKVDDSNRVQLSIHANNTVNEDYTVLIQDDLAAFADSRHVTNFPYINTLPVPTRHTSNSYTTVLLEQPRKDIHSYTPLLRLYNVDCNSQIYMNTDWSVTVPDANWKWPLEGIPLRRKLQPGQCAGGPRSGRVCDAAVTCSFGVCKNGRCMGGSFNGKRCDPINDGSLQCPQAQSCYTAEGAYPTYPKDKQWYAHPRLPDCSELWCA